MKAAVQKAKELLTPLLRKDLQTYWGFEVLVGAFKAPRAEDRHARNPTEPEAETGAKGGRNRASEERGQTNRQENETPAKGQKTHCPQGLK